MNDTHLELTVERPVAGGRMLARHEGRIVLVAGAIPGERVTARVDRRSRSVWWAAVTEVLDPSPDRREPMCDPSCGGLTYAHIAYARQLRLKQEVIGDAFRRIARQEVPVPIPLESPERGYRLRVRLHVAGDRVGFYREGTHRLCAVASTGQVLPGTMAAVDRLVAALGPGLAAFDALVVAENVAANGRVVHLEPRQAVPLDGSLRLGLPEGLTGVTTSVRGRLTTVLGQPVVTDTAASLFGENSPVGALPTWTRHPLSFFQANRFLVGSLTRQVIDACGDGQVVDLYAGVGLFALCLAARGAQVVAVEGDRSSGLDLRANARPWRERLRVIRAPVEQVVGDGPDNAPDAVVLDPPRTGMSAAAMSGLLRWEARRVVYVSCDPPTLARDAGRLAAGGYTLHSLAAFDLFPNTPHVETVAVFER